MIDNTRSKNKVQYCTHIVLYITYNKDIYQILKAKAFIVYLLLVYLVQFIIKVNKQNNCLQNTYGI